jgi:RNA polymerase sigma-70 factor (ECF subfamily)
MEPSDHELMSRCREGDVAAFEAIVHRWDGRVRSLLRRLVANAADVDDLRQETFVRVLRASSRYRENGAFSTLLFRIAINLARDAARRRRARPTPLDQHEPIDNGDGPDVIPARNELHACLDAALIRLPPELRELLVVKHFCQLTFAEASHVLGEPASTLKSRMLVALRELRAELLRMGVTEGDLES